MSMDALRNAVRRDAEQIVASVAQDRNATVASVDPNTGSVRVTIQPEGILSGWLPDCSMVSASGGYGFVMPLTEGDQVTVGFLHGDADHPYVTGRVFSTVDKMPNSSVTQKPVQPGEIGVFLPSGAYLHGTGGKWFFGGDLVVTGNVTSTMDVADKHGSLDRLRGNYDGHDHMQSVGATTKPDAE